MSDALDDVRRARARLTAASAELRRTVVAAIASGEHTVTDIADAAGITRPTAYRWWHDQTEEREEPMTNTEGIMDARQDIVYLHETDATVYIQRGNGPVWGVSGLDLSLPEVGQFEQDARAWLEGEWAPTEGEWTTVSDQGTKLVASYNLVTGLNMLREPGGNAETYLANDDKKRR